MPPSPAPASEPAGGPLPVRPRLISPRGLVQWAGMEHAAHAPLGTACSVTSLLLLAHRGCLLWEPRSLGEEHVET